MSSQTYHHIWLHFIWTTKNRERLLTKEVKAKLMLHYLEYAKESDIEIDVINGDMDHLHLLIQLKPNQNPANIANLLKGESSNWINKNDFLRGKFAWQSGYAVFSVSKSQIQTVRKYIRNQEEHHRRKSFKEEYDEFMKIYG
tara:strand:- start:538 stop:963 length:426 start_codon:yes stop_codon:yes gene_type:complete